MGLHPQPVAGIVIDNGLQTVAVLERRRALEAQLDVAVHHHVVPDGLALARRGSKGPHLVEAAMCVLRDLKIVGETGR